MLSKKGFIFLKTETSSIEQKEVVSFFWDGKGRNDKFGRYSVGFNVGGFSFVNDSGFGVLLWRDGQAKECFECFNAVFYCNVRFKPALGINRL